MQENVRALLRIIQQDRCQRRYRDLFFIKQRIAG